MRRAFRLSRGAQDHRSELVDEIALHLDLRTQEFLAQGMDADAARRAAEASFGDVAIVSDACSVIDSQRRTVRARRERLRDIATDVRLALRSFARNPTVSLSAVLTLGLGIGSAVTVFTILNGVILRPLPYAHPDRLALFWEGGVGAAASEEWPLSAPTFTDIAAQNRTVSDLAAFRSWSGTLGSGVDAEPVRGVRTRPELFAALGIGPELGRTFTDAEAVTGGPAVAVISDALWRRAFGAASTILGRTVTLTGRPFTVVGVMPKGFAFPRGTELPSGLAFGEHTDIWMPLAFTPDDLRRRGTLNLAAVGRLRPGVSLAQADSDLAQIARGITAREGPSDVTRLFAISASDQAAASVRRILLILTGAVALLLLITAANVTSLLIARAVGRGREFALRVALGARHRRIRAQLITEHMVLTAGGTILGLGIAASATHVVVALVPGNLPRADDISIDWRVLAALALLTAVIGVTLGLMATVQARRVRPAAALQESGARISSGPTARRGHRALVVGEVAMSLVLVIAAGLLAGSFARLLRVDPGFDSRNVVTASVTLPIGDSFRPDRDGPSWSAFFDQLIPRFEDIPGVVAAGATSALPLDGEMESSDVSIDGEPAPAGGQTERTQYAVVAGHYFQTLEIPLVAGRLFDNRDRADGQPVVIVNRAFVRRYLAGRDPIGLRLNSGWDFRPTVRVIAGVVADSREGSLEDDPQPTAYVPEAQMTYPALSLVVRVKNGTNASVLRGVRAQVAALQPSVALDNVRPLDTIVRRSMARERFSLVVVGAFAVCALILALVGLYGVIALGVRQRQRELGVRLALGARPSDVRRLVLVDGAQVTLAGIVFGVLSAALLTRFMHTLLYGLSATDPTLFVAATVLVTTVAGCAILLPAVRATKIDPVASLRAE